jgi:hypothetical protein
MTDPELLSYLIVFVISLFFSAIAIDRQTSITSFFAWICWYALGGFHLAFFYDSILLTVVWLFFALGTIFLIYGFALTISMMGEAKKKRELELQ